MSFLDELEKESEKGGSRCQTCAWFLKLSPEEKEGFIIWLEEDRSHRALWRACGRSGLTVCDSSFRDHLANPECQKRCQI